MMQGKAPSLRTCFAALLFFAIPAAAQQGFFIPRNANVYFGGDTATIFSNVTNHGKLGVGKNAVVNFKGALWQNAPDALIVDETGSTTGTGGWIRFMDNTAPQRLLAGYHAATRTGASFPNLQIANRFGVQLQSSAKVRNHLSFEQGWVYLNNQVFVVGDNAPGTISGYSHNRFFVTGTQPGGGLLLRENIRPADGLVVFPIGTKTESYTPAAIQNKTPLGDDFYVSAFDGVKAGLFTGADLTRNGVNTTWQAGKWRHPGRGQAELYLQHRVSEEGDNFAKNRNKAYISQYGVDGWDMGLPQSAPAAGTLTTTQATAAGGLNRRIFDLTSSSTGYFTKFAVPDSLLTKIVWGAFRMSPTAVTVNWQTRPEINVRYYVVQRRLSNETAFTSIGAFSSKAANGISLGFLNYTTLDANSYTGISYYRLQLFDYSGQHSYTNTVAVNSEMGNKIVLWPNPTPGPFSVLANSPLATSLVIYNALGQKLYAQPISFQNQSVVDVKDHRLQPGVYFIGILDKEGNILDGTKLLIQQ